MIIASWTLKSFTRIQKFSTSIMASKSALVLLSKGSEEMEFVIATDVLRRAGISVTVAGVQGSDPHECSRKVNILPDVSLEEVGDKTYDVVVLPGGLGGAKAFSESKIVGALLKRQEASGNYIAAICAAPVALNTHGIGKGSRVTCYPSVEKDLMAGDIYQYSEDRVVVDKKLITSRGPGTAFEFSLVIVKELLGEEEMLKVKKPLLLKD